MLKFETNLLHENVKINKENIYSAQPTTDKKKKKRK